MREQMAGVMRRAAQSVGRLDQACAMSETAREGRDPGHPIHGVAQLRNSRELLDFVSAETGEPGLTRVDAAAAVLRGGDFLTRHIDNGADNERRVACTIGFNRAWQTDWGGLLMFIDQASTDVVRALTPRFNLLALFDPLAVHSVSTVSPFAADGRLAISGWARND